MSSSTHRRLPRPQHFRHAPCLGDAASRREGRIAVEDFTDAAQTVVSQMTDEWLQESAGQDAQQGSKSAPHCEGAARKSTKSDQVKGEAGYHKIERAGSEWQEFLVADHPGAFAPCKKCGRQIGMNHGAHPSGLPRRPADRPMMRAEIERRRKVPDNGGKPRDFVGAASGRRPGTGCGR